MAGNRYKRGDRITYRSGMGFLFSARVERAHRNGEVTVKVLFPLARDGQEMNYGYVGDKWRIGKDNIAEGVSA